MNEFYVRLWSRSPDRPQRHGFSKSVCDMDRITCTVVTDQMPNIVPWCRVAHRPSVAASARVVHFGALSWSFHLSPNHQCFGKKNLESCRLGQQGHAGLYGSIWNNQVKVMRIIVCHLLGWRSAQTDGNRHFVEFCRISVLLLSELVFTVSHVLAFF